MANETEAVVFTGTTMAFGAYVAQITGVEGVGYTSETADASYSDITDGLRVYLAASKMTPSPITFEINFAPTTDMSAVVGTSDTLVITWSDESTWSTTAICTGYTGGGSLGGNTTGRVTFQPSGKAAVA